MGTVKRLRCVQLINVFPAVKIGVGIVLNVGLLDTYLTVIVQMDTSVIQGKNVPNVSNSELSWDPESLLKNSKFTKIFTNLSLTEITSNQLKFFKV